MQKKLSFALSIMLLTGLTNSVNAADWSGIKKFAVVAGVIGVFAGGQYADEMNKEYARTRKDPDAQLALVKSAAGATMLLGADMILHEHDTAENLAKIAAFTIALSAGSDTVAHGINYVAGLVHAERVSACVTGPIVDGKEVKESGAAIRVLAVYVPLRDKFLGMVRAYKKSK
jgi:hypothetical protein